MKIEEIKNSLKDAEKLVTDIESLNDLRIKCIVNL